MVNFKCLYPRKTWRSSLFLALCLFFSQVASAQDYYWYYNGRGIDPPSPVAYCQSRASSDANSESIVHPSSGFERPDQYICVLQMTRPVPQVYPGFPINRGGDGCAEPKKLNPDTGLCELPQPDPCESTIGTTTSHLHRIGDFSGAGVINGRTDPPGRICSSSCQYAWDGGAPTSALRFVSGNPNGVFGTFTYKGNGVKCTESDTAVAVPGSPEATKEKQSDCTTKVTDAEGRTHYTCQTAEVFKEPGSMKCGTVQGEFKCLPSKPSPKLDDKKVTTEVTEKTNSDGSKNTETKTTTTVTTCSGANSCTTTTTTNTTNTKTNADGSSGGETSTCSGVGCGGSKPDGSETPPEEEEEGSAVSGDMACTAVPACEGDAIQCAILRQTQQQRCGDEEFREVTDKKITDLKSSLAAEFSGEEYQPLKATADGTFDMSSMIDTSSRFSKTCPVLPDIQYTWLDGSRQSLPLADALNNMCTVFTWLGYFVVAFAMRRGAEIVAGGLA